MFPRTQTLSTDVAVTILGYCASNKQRTVQSYLLHWVLLVMHAFQGQMLSNALYGLLFHYLDYDTLMPVLSRLLFRLTEKKHVKPFRIHRLYTLSHHGKWCRLWLQSKYGNDPDLMRLVFKFHQHEPSLVVHGSFIRKAKVSACFSCTVLSEGRMPTSCG
jgi:hypothetical protein